MKRLLTLSILGLFLLIACNNKTTLKKELEKEKKSSVKEKTQNATYTDAPFLQSTPVIQQPISEFVRRIFQDSKGNMWLGTNGDGVIFYDGNNVTYHSIDEGFEGYAVRGIVEDKNGFIWLGTERGLVKYDPNISAKPTPKSFSTYSQKEGLPHYDIWHVFIDSKDILWVSTYQGVASFDGTTFTIFPLPEAKADLNRGVSHPKIVSNIFEDSQGNIWFSTPGGAYKFNGETLQYISEKDGLAGNSINHIIEDNNKNLWFATFYNGVSSFDGKKFKNYTKDGVIDGEEVWSLFKDNEGNIWFPAEHHGVYKYDGEKFTNYQKEQGLNSGAIQCIFQDTNGTIWFGGYLGLFKLDGEQVVAVTKVDLEN